MPEGKRQEFLWVHPQFEMAMRSLYKILLQLEREAQS